MEKTVNIALRKGHASRAGWPPTACCRLHGLVEPIEVLQFGYVALNACNVAADRLDGRFELLLPAPCYEDVGAFIDKSLGGRETYSCGAAGNHGHLAL